MSVLLSCDAPNCPQTTLALVRLGRPSAPDGWWMQPNTAGRLIVACSEQHINAALKAAGSD